MDPASMKLPQMTDVHHLFNPAIAPPLVATKTGSHSSHLASLHSRHTLDARQNFLLTLACSFLIFCVCVCSDYWVHWSSWFRGQHCPWSDEASEDHAEEELKARAHQHARKLQVWFLVQILLIFY